MALLGINVAGRAEQSPAAIAALGAMWARCVGYRDVNISEWIRGCQERGVKVLMVLARESIDGDWQRNISRFRDLYSGRVNAIQIGNEPDHESPSSWTMTPRDLNRLLVTARGVFGPDKLLIGPGLVSGQPSWASLVDWSPVDAICIHPYAKDPGTPDLDNLLDGYRLHGKPLWVTEYHARTRGMAAALRDDRRVRVALAFCMTDRMVPGFGLLEDQAALNDFKAAAGGGQTVPAYEYQLGIKAKADALRADGFDPGRPLEPETYPYENSPYSYQMGERGLFIYSKAANKVLFLESR